MPDTGTGLPKADFSKHRLVVVMATYYTSLDDTRYQAALATLVAYRSLSRRHTKFGVAVIVVDASPDSVNQLIRDSFSKLGALVLVADKGGLAPQNLQGLRFAFAHGAKVALRQEPEKTGLAQVDNLFKIVSAVNEGNHLVVVGRDRQTIESMPYEQQLTETIMGELLASAGLPPDSAAGPRAMDVVGFNLVESLDYDQIGNQWEFLWWPLVISLSDGDSVGYVECNFPYSPDMVEQEQDNPDFIAKRLDQAVMILAKVLREAALHGLLPVYNANLTANRHLPKRAAA